MRPQPFYSSLLVLIVGIFSVAYIARVSIQPAGVSPRSQMAAVDLTSNLLIHYAFDDDAANTVALDSQGLSNGKATVNTNALHTAGATGSGAFLFDGTSQYIDSNYIWHSGDSSFTIAVWAKFTSTSSGLPFLSTYNGQPGVIGLGTTNGGRINAQAYDTSNHSVNLNTPSAYNDGAWHHAVFVVSGTAASLYVDGTLQVSSTNASMTGIYSSAGSYSMKIGGSNVKGSATYFPGSLDDVRIYNRALSADEVSQLYSNGGGTSQTGTTQTPAPVNGMCSVTVNTCASGTFSDTADSGTQNLWNCAGSNGGTTAQCSANIQMNTNTLPAPTNVTATALSSNQINLTWTPVTGATSYKIFRNTSAIGVSNSASYSAQSLNPATTYGFTVAAMDSSGNTSPNQSASVSGTTLAANASPTGYQLSVYTYTHAGQGSVTGTVNGAQIINCGSTCSKVLNANDPIVLTAIPAAGSSVSRWEDCPGATGNTCTIAMPNWNMSIGVVFTTPFTPKNKLSDIIHDGMTWVFVGDSFTTLETYSAYIESYFELRNPSMHLHFRNAARSGAALGDFTDDPTINPHVDPTTGNAVGYNLDGRFDRWVYGWYPDVISVDFSDNGHPSPQQLATDYTNFIKNYIVPNHSTPVLLGPWPINVPNLLGSGTYMETLSDAIDSVSTNPAAYGSVAQALVDGTIWHEMAAIMAPNLSSTNPVNLDGLTGNTDTEHLNEAGTLAAASYALQKMGADGNVSSMTIDANAGTVTAASNLNAPAVGSAVTKNQYSGVDFTRYDARLPMAFDDLSRPVMQIDPQILDMNRYMLTVSNLSPGTYDIYIDGTPSATVDSNTLASGWNMTTMTQGPIHDQLEEVLGRIRDKEGVDRANATLYSPQQRSDPTNPCVPAGKNWWGVTNYNSNAGLYDSGGYRGESLVSQLAYAKVQTECLDNRLWQAEQPVSRTFSIRKKNGTISNDNTPPTVSISSPSNGSTVSGTAVVITASASDLVGVAGVQFKLDGATLGTEDTAYPYSLAWDSTKVTAGTHSIVAVARDAAGNRATSTVTTVTVSVAQGVTPSTAFKIGDRVNPDQDLVNVRSTPAGATINTQDTITVGTVVGGPTVASLSGVSYSWWNIDFDTGADGWVAEPFLEKNTAANTTLPALSISAISSSTGATSAAIQWTTNNPATSQVEYGLTTAYGSFTALAVSTATLHTVNIAGLSAATVYHFRVASKDSTGTLASSTPDMTFMTTAAAVQGSIGIASRVQITQPSTIAYSGVKITNPSPTLLQTGVFNAGDLGIITQGPIALNGATYWNVNMDNSKIPNYDGWIDASNLVPYTSTSTNAPVGNDRTVKMYAGIAQAFSVDAADADGDMIRINFPATTAKGGRLILTNNLPVTQASLSKDLNFIYVPPAGASSDSFRYSLTDGVNTSPTYTVNFIIQPVTSSTWIPPIGIPRPEFGIDDTYRMYDDPANRNPALTYSPSTSGGYYTQYVDNRTGCVTTSNGTAAAPLCAIPANLPAGSVVEIHGGPFTNAQPTINSYTGTIAQPIFIRGVGMPRIAPANAWLLSNNQNGGGQYVVVEDLDLFSFSVGRRYSHVTFRNSDVHGDENGGGTNIQDSDTNYPILENIVFYHNKVHDVGIWDTNRIAALCASGVKPPVGPDPNYCDRDIADTVFAWQSLAENIWVLDSDLSHSEGDSVQVNAGGQGVSLNPNLHHVYIGRNEMHENKQTATAIKAATHVVFSQNDMWGIATSTSSLGTATGFSDEGPTDTWWIFNRIHDNEIGTKMNAGRGPGPYYYIGNLIYDIHDKYPNTQLTGTYSQVGQAVADWHEAPTYFINNTIYDSDFGFGIWTGNWTGTQPFVISNNIIAKTDTVGQEIYNQGDKFLEVNKNLFQGSASDSNVLIYWIGKTTNSISAFESAVGPTNASGNTSGDPMFVDPSSGDFNLKQGSPAIDAGDSTLMEQAASEFYTTFGSDIRKDFNGNNRPANGAYDLGAIEYGATGGNQPPPAVIPVTNPVTTPTTPTDTDGDGVADSSDLCASTPAVRTVNSVGCPLPVATNFTVTPSLASANLNSVSNLSIANSFGKITWTSPVSLVHNTDRIDLNANAAITKGTVTVNSAIAPELNKPATITFYNIILSSLSALKILRDGAICPSCTAATYVNGTLTFNVPGFSTYSIFDDTSTTDTTAPTVSVTAPADASTVSGSVHFTVSASDDTGVVGVQYKLDGANLNGEALNDPFDITFDTTGISNGNHTLLAVARDAAGNMATSSPVTIVVNNTTAPTGGTSGNTGGGSSGSNTSSGSSGGGGGGGGGGGYVPPAAPTISDIKISGTASSGVTVAWTSSVLASSQINYGLTASYGLSTIPDSLFVTSHSQKLTSLLANSLYHLQLRSKDAYGNLITSSDLTFFVPTTGSVSLATPISTTGANMSASAGAVSSWLALGATNQQVKALQQMLNADGFQVALSGPGSPGNESTYFGPATQAALQRFQCAKLQVCSGDSSATGYGATGPRTRNALNALGGAYVQATTPARVQVPAAVLGSITAWLLLGTTNPQVKTLQQILNSKGFAVAPTGTGSRGNESTYFGPATQAALQRFQCAKLSVCSGAPYTTGYGATGPKTRAALDAK